MVTEKCPTVTSDNLVNVLSYPQRQEEVTEYGNFNNTKVNVIKTDFRSLYLSTLIHKRDLKSQIYRFYESINLITKLIEILINYTFPYIRISNFSVHHDCLYLFIVSGGSYWNGVQSKTSSLLKR